MIRKEAHTNDRSQIGQGTSALFSKLRSLLPSIVFILCVIQPVLEVIGYWQVQLNVSNTFTMLIRMLLLGGAVLLGFFLSDRKKYYFAAAGVLLLLTGFHILACSKDPDGYKGAVSDLINLVRIYFLPMMTLCFITFLRQNEKVFPAMRLGMVIDILLIALVQLLSTVTKTDPHTYSADGTGVLGWFMWTNSQSAILGMLSPIVICWSLQRWKGKLMPIALITAVSLATLYVLAPRLSFASMIGSGAGFAICVLLFKRQYWKQAILIFGITLLFFALMPLSPMQKRLNDNAARARASQEDIDERHLVIPDNPVLPSGSELTTEEPITTELTETDTGETGTEAETEETEPGEEPPSGSEPSGSNVLDEKTAKELENLYKSRYMIWSMVERFGRERVFEVYKYTLDPEVLSNTRNMKINFCRLLMQESGTMSKLFGLNLNEMTMTRYDKDGILVTDNYDVENDYHGVYFLTGAVGLVLMLLFLLFFGVRTLIAIIRNPKQNLSLTVISFCMAYGIGLIHAYYTASVLRRNNASIYLAMVLACLYCLPVLKKQETHKLEAEH